RLAGLPMETIRLAERFLREEETAVPGGPPSTSAPPTEAARPAQQQLFAPLDLVARQIAGLQIDRMTPLEALELLARLKKELADGGGN
ncbi:MAG TPA: hypothetical protein VL359_04840, partial [bacterium]|nr:hypothetical protein [bacterium]